MELKVWSIPILLTVIVAVIYNVFTTDPTNESTSMAGGTQT